MIKVIIVLAVASIYCVEAAPYDPFNPFIALNPQVMQENIRNQIRSMMMNTSRDHKGVGSSAFVSTSVNNGVQKYKGVVGSWVDGKFIKHEFSNDKKATST